MRSPERQREAVRRHYQANKEYYKVKAKRFQQEMERLIREAKETPCADCGIQYPYFVMDFDHRDPSDKLFEVSQMAKRSGRKRILAEMAKCDIVCSNCHRIRTHAIRI